MSEPARATVTRVTALDLQSAARPVAAMERFYPGAMDFGWHSHRRAQFLHCVQGFMTARVPGTSFIIPSGHGLVIAPDLPHAVKAHGPVRMWSVYAEPEACGEPAWDGARVVQASRLLCACLEALVKEPAEGGSERADHLSALVLGEIAAAEPGRLALPEPAERRIQSLCRELSAQPATDLDIDAWADRLGMSRRTLTRRFRTETGMSFVEWRRRLRVAHVMRLKAEGERLEDIAERVGYRSVSALRAALREALP
ncbi:MULTISPECIES: helix-turn-helix domain-containing protein [unclassified Aureimonas]|uniref:AraC family transcriptional regulator n=1 Tax=unclassified Aureimonas TaxID=2615206 RepID=UPI001FCD9EEC|nr:MULTISPECIES: helix-turn-helix transcriptional regulator [unclassified Aureimonas]